MAGKSVYVIVQAKILFVRIQTEIHYTAPVYSYTK